LTVKQSQPRGGLCVLRATTKKVNFFGEKSEKCIWVIFLVEMKY